MFQWISRPSYGPDVVLWTLAEAVKWVKVFASRMDPSLKQRLAFVEASQHIGVGAPCLTDYGRPIRAIFKKYPKYLGLFGYIDQQGCEVFGVFLVVLLSQIL